MLKKIVLILVFIALTGWMVFKGTVSPHSVMTIGILQTASHPALDLARDGFMAELKKLSPLPVDFVVQNAEGSQVQAQSIASSFHAHKKISAIFAIGTPAVQAAAKLEREKPLFIAAVSDPAALHLSNTNLCGTSDQIDSDAQADLIVRLLPTAESVALIYNPAENNSSIMVEKIQRSLEKKGLKSHVFGVHSGSDLPQVVRSACAKGDVILVPNDNLVAANMPLVAKEAALRQCPLIVSDPALLEQGALAALGAEYSEMGRVTAQIAHRVLFGGVSPEMEGIVHPSHPQTCINHVIAKRLELDPVAMEE